MWEYLVVRIYSRFESFSTTNPLYMKHSLYDTYIHLNMCTPTDIKQHNTQYTHMCVYMYIYIYMYIMYSDVLRRCLTRIYIHIYIYNFLWCFFLTPNILRCFFFESENMYCEWSTLVCSCIVHVYTNIWCTRGVHTSWLQNIWWIFGSNILWCCYFSRVHTNILYCESSTLVYTKYSLMLLFFSCASFKIQEHSTYIWLHHATNMNESFSYS